MKANIGRELTLRALITGVVLGVILTPCNVYSGLKIGWSFNMSITAALLSYAFWKTLQQLRVARPWMLLESNINQTAASAAASIISGGLVAPIPALTLLTGQQLPWFELVLWVFGVSFLGVWVAWFLRRQLLETAPLTFPAGVATAETLKDIFAHGREAVKRVVALFAAALFAGGAKWLDSVFTLPRWSPPFSLPGKGAVAAVSAVSLKNLGFMLDPSPLLIGFGAIIGLRTGLSLLLGAVLAWGVLGPLILYHGWARPGELDAGAVWFAPMVEWLLWPGVALMVVSSLMSFALLFVKSSHRDADNLQPESVSMPRKPVFPAGFLPGLGIASALVIALQMLLFDIGALTAVLAVPLAFVLAVVAGRVVGETGIPPIGAIGKVSQLTFGVISPNNVIANLMTANVAGGAAGQCADLLNDFKTGLLVGATPARQMTAQIAGVLAGSIAGSLVYRLLIPDPTAMLITPEWPSPAVATWKAVAETLQHGLSTVPMHARYAMLIAAVIGAALALGEKFLPQRHARRLPGAPALGLAFVIPASISIAMFVGALLAFLLQRFALNWSQRFLIACAAGLVAGESIAGVISSVAAIMG